MKNDEIKNEHREGDHTDEESFALEKTLKKEEDAVDVADLAGKREDERNEKEALDEEKKLMLLKEEQLRKEQEAAYLLQVKENLIDQDLFEHLTNEEMLLILDHELRTDDHETSKKMTLKIKVILVMLSLFVFVNIFFVFYNVYELPTHDFLRNAIKLSFDEDIQFISETVVVVNTGDGKGTGFLISSYGDVITNAHVVKDETAVAVHVAGVGTKRGLVMHKNEAVDLAYVKIEEGDYSYLTLSDQQAQKGDNIKFVGNPFSYTRLPNEGVIKGRTKASLDTDVLKLDAPIYQGNSGSPVLNADNEVVGVIYATLTSEAEGTVGLAIPVSELRLQLDEWGVGDKHK